MTAVTGRLNGLALSVMASRLLTCSTVGGQAIWSRSPTAFAAVSPGRRLRPLAGHLRVLADPLAAARPRACSCSSKARSGSADPQSLAVVADACGGAADRGWLFRTAPAAPSASRRMPAAPWTPLALRCGSPGGQPHDRARTRIDEGKDLGGLGLRQRRRRADPAQVKQDPLKNDTILAKAGTPWALTGTSGSVEWWRRPSTDQPAPAPGRSVEWCVVP